MWRFSRLERLLPSFVEGATQIEKVERVECRSMQRLKRKRVTLMQLDLD